MSEPVLDAIIKLFALVANEDQVTKQERDRIQLFLSDHLSQKSVVSHLQLFDQYSRQLSEQISLEKESQLVEKICASINADTAKKQKIVILVELMSIILADGHISERENRLALQICQAFSISSDLMDVIKTFILGDNPLSLDDPSILIIHSGEKITTHAKVIQRTHLRGTIALLRINIPEIYFFKYHGPDDVYLNGVPVKSGNINVLATGSTVRWGTSDPVYYGDILNQFKKAKTTTRTSFEARNLFFTFKNGKLGLRDVSIYEESGSLVALMGASGAGKSTLLHVLNGSEKPSDGQVLINGIDIHRHPEKIEGVIGFVPQDDLLMEDLTVYQNLYFAAKLCFANRSEEEIDFLVMKTLDDLGLIETKDLKVGSPLRKTISGGQRKRLNIGLELLREPAVLFVDEPTSGLSSRDSENIIDLLKELALKGRLVFAVIHQPSSDIFKMFDKLVILDTGGYQIYYGNPVEAITYFKKNINLINSDEGECHACGNVNPEQIFNIIETKVINEYGNFTNERKFSSEQWNQLYREKIKISEITTSKDRPHSTLRIPTWIKQMQLFSLRDFLSKLSNTQYLVINLLEAPLLAFILAFIVRYYNTDNSSSIGYLFSKNLNMPAYLFMSVIVALFMGLTVSAEEIIRDRKILKREKFLHLSRSSYVLSKVGILFMISGIQTGLFVLVGNYILEIEGMFLSYWLILFSTSCFANLVGLNISSAFNSAVTIYILIPILLIPQLILSGVVVKFDKLNPSIGNNANVPLVGDLMASRWAFEALMVTQFKSNPFEKRFYEWDKTMAESDYKKVYYLPELESRIGLLQQLLGKTDSASLAKSTSTLSLLKRELQKEVDIIGGSSRFNRLNDFTPDRFDSTVTTETRQFIQALKRFYLIRYERAEKEKLALIEGLTNTPAKQLQFEKDRNTYQNEAITELVRNTIEMNRVIEKDGQLVQKIFPIYKTPAPDHLVDFNAQFYMPAKHFLGHDIDTLFFNMLVIWGMTLLLLMALQYELLRRVVDGLSNLSNPIPKRM